MTVLLSIHQIIVIIVGLGTILGFVFRYFHNRLREAWSKDLNILEQKLDDKIEEECSPEVIRTIVREELNIELRLVNKSLEGLTKTLERMEEKIDRQEETIIAMQNSLTGISTNQKNLEKETDRLEDKKQDKAQ